MKEPRRRKDPSLHEYMEDLARARGPAFTSQIGAAPREAAPATAEGEAAPRQVDPLVGRIFDERYELIRLLGRDKLAATYEVRHLRLGKRFTMKVINPLLLEDPKLLDTFEKSAHDTSRLSFPNCMSVTDFGQTEQGELYLVTEFLEGTPLAALLEQLLPLGTALEITRQILLGLQHAHQAGVLHLGLTPEGVLLTLAEGQWRVKIVDFAVSRLSQQAAGAAPGAAADDAAGLDCAYRAPEQQGSESPDERADLFAVGVMLWQMITGRMPPAVSSEVARQQRGPELEQVAPGAFAAELQALVRGALAPDRAGRFASAKEMLDGLERILKQPGRGLAAPEPGRSRGATQLRSRRGALVLGGTAVLVAGVAVALTLFAPASPQQAAGRSASGSSELAAAAARTEDQASARRKTPSALRQIRGLISRGACSEAGRRLARLPEAEQQHPQAQLLLGAALCCQKSYAAGLQAYAGAVAADSALQFNSQLLQDLRRMLHAPKQTETALVFAAERMGEPGQALVIDAASNSRDLRVRHLAASVARQRGLEDRVDWVSSRGLDLIQQKDCELQRQVIADLRALGDPRAIKALEQVRSKRVWVDRVGYSGWQEKSSCVSKEAEEAIGYLSSKGGAPR